MLLQQSHFSTLPWLYESSPHSITIILVVFFMRIRVLSISGFHFYKFFYNLDVSDREFMAQKFIETLEIYFELIWYVIYNWKLFAIICKFLQLFYNLLIAYNSHCIYFISFFCLLYIYIWYQMIYNY